MDTETTAHLSPAMKRRIAEEAAAGQRRLKHHAGTRASTDQAIAAAKALEAPVLETPAIVDHVVDAPLEEPAPRPTRRPRQPPVADAPVADTPADPIDSLLD